MPLTLLNLLVHPVLAELVVEHILVRRLQFLFVDTLLFDVLRSLRAASFLTLAICLLHSVLLFLLTHSEVLHVLLVNVRLLVQCSALLCQEPLLVGVEWIVVKLRSSRQVLPGLTRFYGTGVHRRLPRGCQRRAA